MYVSYVRRLASRRIIGLVCVLVLAVIGVGVLGIEPPNRSSAPPLPSVRASGLATVVRVGLSSPPGEFAFLAVDDSGNLVVSDRQRRSVLRFDPAGQLLSEWGPRYGDLMIDEPAGVAARGNRYYVLDRGTPRLFSFDVNGTPQGFVDLADLSPYGLNGLAIDPSGNLFAADTGRNRLLVFNPRGGYTRDLGRTGSGLGEFTQPMGLAFAPDGSFVVADWENARVERWDAGLNATDAWEPGFRPYGVAVDELGRVYVPDPTRERVEVFTPDGTKLGELGGPGEPIDVSEPRQVASAPPGTPSVYVLGTDGVARVDLQNGPPPPPQSQSVDVVSLTIIGLLVGVVALAILARRRRAASVEVSAFDRPVGLGAKDGAQCEQQQAHPDQGAVLVAHEADREQQPRQQNHQAEYEPETDHAKHDTGHPNAAR